MALAQRAERLGYTRVWYAEHHNIAAIASSATSVLIAHIAANTERIRVGAGGIMLPNHAPLVIAEQFGTLESPASRAHRPRPRPRAGHATRRRCGRCAATRARPTRFRRTCSSCRAFSPASRASPVSTPSREGNERAALHPRLVAVRGAARRALGLPYAFASHFAPAALEQAVEIYRREFRPSEQLERPYFIAGINVIAADTASDAAAQFAAVKRLRVQAILGRGRSSATMSSTRFCSRRKEST